MTAATDDDRVTALEADNRRLRRLLDQHDAPGELRHRLRGTLALLRAVVRRSADTTRTLPDYVAQLEDRLDAITRAQARADADGDVSLSALIADELFQYHIAEGERLALSGPEVRLQPRAGQVVALAVHELAVNAVEHGALGDGTGRVDVGWTVAADEPERPLVLVWTELGLPPDLAPVREGFGTEVLTRMLPYEMRAETEIAFGPGEFRCTIRFPLSERVGRLASA